MSNDNNNNETNENPLTIHKAYDQYIWDPEGAEANLRAHLQDQDMVDSLLKGFERIKKREDNKAAIPTWWKR